MKTYFAAMAALCIGISAPAFAQEHGHFGHGGMMEIRSLLKAANLTPDQKTQVHQIMQSSRAENKALFTQMKALHEQLADKLASAGPVSVSDLTAIHAQIAQLRSQLDVQMAQNAIKVRAILTADQLRQVSATHEQLKSLRAQMKALTPEEDERGFGGPVER